MGHKSTEKYNDICTLKHNLLHYVMGEVESGLEGDPTKVHVLKDYIEMIKCLAEAEKECQEADYYESVVGAMDTSGMIDTDRRGYSPDMMQSRKMMRWNEMPGDDPDDWGDYDGRHSESFNRFRKAKRHYTKTHSEADKQMMKDASNEHMMDTMATIREMWDDADPDLRTRMKTDLTTLVANLK